MFNFEKLEVWEKAVDLADRIYSLTKLFPAEERFGLTNQMRRASVAISSNIAEGTSRSSTKDFARFVELATGSLFEIVSQAYIAQRQEFLSPDNFQLIYNQSEELGRMLSGLRNHLIQSNPST